MKLKTKSWTLIILLSMVFSLVVSGTLSAIGIKADTTDPTYEKIEKSGVLTVGTSPDYAPYEFQTTENGKSVDVGMDINIAKKIAADMHVKLKIKNMDFDSLLVALQTGKVDMVLAGMNPSPARKKSVDFSNVYYTGGQSILVNTKDAGIYKDKNSFEHKKVAAQTGSLQYNLAKNQIKDSSVTGIEKGTDLILALQTNKVDGVVMETPTAEAFASNNKGIKVIKGGFDLSSADSSTAVALPQNSPMLKKHVNTTLATIKKEKLIPVYLKEAGSHLKSNTANTSMLHYWKFFAMGVGYTVFISIIAVFLGSILGTLLALMRLSANKLSNLVATAYIEFVRGTPLMVQLMFVYFGLGLFVNLPALTAGIIAVALNSAAYVAEVIRGGINSIDKGQTEASQSLGLSKSDQMRFVILPQALKNIWPALGNEFISLIKESSIVSIIGVTDLIYQLKIVQADTYRGVAPILVAMILYFILTFSLSKLLKFYEGKFNHA
ncbi:Amino acid ABC transporter, permease/substrate-binding protein [Pediococcus claussenii ATCC BAA-344]|uniref:Amino acid ABC transporter, permease/substrate-binding protein n=2 Tax=Pediococcus claussenii TaxID=187452 RepID=G8PCZ5_PEDCP|nr:Amino acid ABC transporter, permease/substrate-binding protein [Pediococcus claussenii ATCC BAA-344]